MYPTRARSVPGRAGAQQIRQQRPTTGLYLRLPLPVSQHKAKANTYTRTHASLLLPKTQGYSKARPNQVKKTSITLTRQEKKKSDYS